MSEDPQNTNGPERPDDEYPVLPPEPQQVKPKLPSEPVDLDEIYRSPATDDVPFQFSLAEMMWLMLAAALVLGLLSYVPGEHSMKAAAGIAGVGLILFGLVLELLKPARRILYVGWSAAFVLYLIICLAAAFVG